MRSERFVGERLDWLKASNEGQTISIDKSTRPEKKTFRTSILHFIPAINDYNPFYAVCSVNK